MTLTCAEHNLRLVTNTRCKVHYFSHSGRVTNLHVTMMKVIMITYNRDALIVNDQTDKNEPFHVS